MIELIMELKKNKGVKRINICTKALDLLIQNEVTCSKELKIIVNNIKKFVYI